LDNSGRAPQGKALAAKPCDGVVEENGESRVVGKIRGLEVERQFNPAWAFGSHDEWGIAGGSSEHAQTGCVDARRTFNRDVVERHMLHDRMVFHPRFKSRMRNVSGRLPQPWSFQRSD